MSYPNEFSVRCVENGVVEFMTALSTPIGAEFNDSVFGDLVPRHGGAEDLERRNSWTTTLRLVRVFSAFFSRERNFEAKLHSGSNSSWTLGDQIESWLQTSSWACNRVTAALILADSWPREEACRRWSPALDNGAIGLEVQELSLEREEYRKAVLFARDEMCVEEPELSPEAYIGSSRLVTPEYARAIVDSFKEGLQAQLEDNPKLKSLLERVEKDVAPLLERKIADLEVYLSLVVGCQFLLDQALSGVENRRDGTLKGFAMRGFVRLCAPRTSYRLVLARCTK